MRKKILLFGSTALGLISPALALAAFKFENPSCADNNCFLIDLSKVPGGYENTFPGLIAFLINIGLGVVGIITVAFIMYGGFEYITARGNEEQAESGKRTLTNAIIGLVITILAYVIVVVIINALKGKVR